MVFTAGCLPDFGHLNHSAPDSSRQEQNNDNEKAVLPGPLPRLNNFRPDSASANFRIKSAVAPRSAKRAARDIKLTTTTNVA